MKLVASIKNLLILLAVLLLNSISFAGHASATTTLSHEMGGMNHKVSDNTSCATQCRTAVVNRDENSIKESENEDDDKPTMPFYVYNQQFCTDSKSNSQQLYAAGVKPPPKIPIYILYGVFRA